MLAKVVPFLFAVAAAQCYGGMPRIGAEVDTLVAAINAKESNDDKLKELNEGLRRSSLGLSSEDVLKIAELRVVETFHSIRPYVLGITTDHEVTLLQFAATEEERLTILDLTCDLVVAVHNAASIAKIIDTFTSVRYQEQARQVLYGCPRFSCVYGNIDAKKLTFVVETSTSMGETFADGDVGQQPRLSYVQKELDVVIKEQLPRMEGREFNLISYSDVSAVWAVDLQTCTPEKLFSAEKFVHEMLDARKVTAGRDLYSALQLAFAQNDVDAVYLVSAGLPTGFPTGLPYSLGQASNEEITLAAAKAWCREGEVPLHTVALVAGGSESTTEKAATRDFLLRLAHVCGGVFRSVEEETTHAQRAPVEVV